MLNFSTEQRYTATWTSAISAKENQRRPEIASTKANAPKKKPATSRRGAISASTVKRNAVQSVSARGNAHLRIASRQENAPALFPGSTNATSERNTLGLRLLLDDRTVTITIQFHNEP